MTNRVQLVLHGGDWTTARVCTFNRAGAGFAARTYVMSATVPSNWNRIYAMVWTLDGPGTFRVTRGDLRYVPGAVVPNGLLCGQVAPTVTPTRTPTSTPTQTPTPTFTSTPTPVFYPSPTLTAGNVRYYDFTLSPFGHQVDFVTDRYGNSHRAGDWQPGQGFVMTDYKVDFGLPTGNVYVGQISYTFDTPQFLSAVRIQVSAGTPTGIPCAWNTRN